jgi:hypothetical protein
MCTGGMRARERYRYRTHAGTQGAREQALYLAHSLGELLPISSFVMKPSLSRLICQNCHTMALSEGAVGSRQRSS